MHKLNQLHKKILEIGCGHGYITNRLQTKYAEATGIDLSSENIKIAKSKFPKIKFIKMDATSLKFKENTFHEIHAIDVLEHVDELNKVISEIKRVLKERGKVIINIPAEKSEDWLIKIRPSYFKEIHHVRVFRRDQLEKIMNKNGFHMDKKIAKGFTQHVELYYLFKSTQNSDKQLAIGHREANLMNRVVYALTILFEPACLNTPLKFFPIWVLTIPVGTVINNIGNKFFPKSIYYEFTKI